MTTVTFCACEQHSSHIVLSVCFCLFLFLFMFFVFVCFCLFCDTVQWVTDLNCLVDTVQYLTT